MRLTRDVELRGSSFICFVYFFFLGGGGGGKGRGRGFALLGGIGTFSKSCGAALNNHMTTP